MQKRDNLYALLIHGRSPESFQENPPWLAKQITNYLEVTRETFQGRAFRELEAPLGYEIRSLQADLVSDSR